MSMTRRHFVLSTSSTLVASTLPLSFFSWQAHSAQDKQLISQPITLAAHSIAQIDTAAKVIAGINIPLTNEFVPEDRPTIIWADTVIITGEITTGGHDLLISARTVRFDSAALINTKAPPPKPDFKDSPPAAPGAHAGDGGTDGSNGGPGGHAGDVLLIAQHFEGNVVIKADGQRGGHAQSGGYGRTGKSGADAPRDCTNGSPGGQGGIGGKAGTPGNGGNGGQINLISTNGFQIEEATLLSFLEGDAGASATHGAPGAGGPGGKRGEALYEEIELCSGMHCI